MVCCPRWSGVTAVASVDIAAPCETVWEVIADLEGSPSIISPVVSVERTGGGAFEVGTKWREIRSYKGNEMVINKTITGMSEDPYIVNINVNFNEIEDTLIQNAVNTSTLTVEPVDDTSCRLIGTFAIASAGFWIKFYGCCMIRSAQKSFQAELEDYEAAALMRVQRENEES